MTPMTDRWREISRQRVFEKYGRAVECVAFEMPDGTRADYYIKAERPTACVVALTLDQLVVLVRQFRPGPMRTLYELPGGFVSDDESPSTAIARELLEEAGLVGEIREIAEVIDDAYSTVIRHCFVATGCRHVSDIKLDPTEFLSVEYVTVSQLRALLRSGQMTDVEAGYLALDHLGLL